MVESIDVVAGNVYWERRREKCRNGQRHWTKVGSREVKVRLLALGDMRLFQQLMLVALAASAGRGRSALFGPANVTTNGDATPSASKATAGTDASFDEAHLALDAHAWPVGIGCRGRVDRRRGG
jgi:hypothetical protein